MKHWRRRKPVDTEIEAVVIPIKKPVEYRHMMAWFVMLGTADYTQKAYLKEAADKDAPPESIYPIYEVDEEDEKKRVKFTGKWMQYKNLDSKHMIEGIEKVFKEKGWGTP